MTSENNPHEFGPSDPLVQTDFTPVKVFVIFAEGGPTKAEIIAIWELDDRLRSQPMQQVHHDLSGAREFLLGEWPRPRAMLVVERAKQLRLNAIERDINPKADA